MKRSFWVTLCVAVCFIGMVAVSTVVAGESKDKGKDKCPTCPTCPPPCSPHYYEKQILGAIQTIVTETQNIETTLNTLSTQGVKCLQRKYYLTTFSVKGDGALTACADGYHMASLWEILDPSSLKYDTTIGRTLDDSGQGPPSSFLGWIRTGFINNHPAPDPGQANCRAYTSSDPDTHGTAVALISNWTLSPIARLNVDDKYIYSLESGPAPWWISMPASCGFVYPVWCVSD